MMESKEQPQQQSELCWCCENMARGLLQAIWNDTLNINNFRRYGRMPGTHALCYPALLYSAILCPLCRYFVARLSTRKGFTEQYVTRTYIEEALATAKGMIRMLLASPWKESMPRSPPWIDPNNLPEEFRPSPDYVDIFQQTAHNSPGQPHTSLQLGASFCLDRIDLWWKTSILKNGLHFIPSAEYSDDERRHWVRVRLASLTAICSSENPDDYLLFCCPRESPSSEYVAGRIIEPADSSQNMRLVRTWLTTCQKNHTRCFQPLGGAATISEPLRCLPTRVVDLGELDDPNQIRLFHTGGTIGQYMTLSHRWGSNSLFHSVKLTKDNLDGYCKAIPYSNLTQTFKDAFKICQNLGIRYIWIDALCIVQDDEADWEREAMRMGETFEGSLCTIAAVDSLDAQGETDHGLFMPRCRPRTSIEMPCLEDANMEHDIRLENIRQRFDLAVEGSRWSERGWVFQEKALSRRMVYYTRDQLFWTCTEACHDEQNTEYEFNSQRKAVFMLGCQSSDGALSSETEAPVASLRTSVRAAWGSSMNTGFQEVFKNYSRSKFTHWSDRTVAINSLFSRIEKHSGILFRAGISSTTAVRDLLWEPLKPHDSGAENEETTDEAGKRQYLPSWSWLSHHGPISYRETLMTNEKDPEVLASCSIIEDALHPDDRIGSIRATLVLQAPAHPFQRVSLSESPSWDSPSEGEMVTITRNLPTEHRGEMSPLLLDLSHSPTCTSLLRDPFGESIGWYIPDNGDGSSAGDTILCCALAMTVSALFKHPKSKRNLKWYEAVECLVVRRMNDEGKNHYGRVGIARIFGTDWLERASTRSLKVF